MQWTKRELLLVIGFIAMAAFFFWSLFFSPKEEDLVIPFPEMETEEVIRETSEPLETLTAIMVDVKGAVHSPGVYEVEEGQRVKDVIGKAGGLLPEADGRQINLAMVVHDEMIIYIPTNGEMPFEDPSSVRETQDDGKIPINHADSAQLQTLVGIGPSKAEAILAYREEHGPFKKVEELLEITGIGEKSFEKIKDKVKIN